MAWAWIEGLNPDRYPAIALHLPSFRNPRWAMSKEVAERVANDCRRNGLVQSAEVRRIDERLGLGEPVKIEPES